MKGNDVDELVAWLREQIAANEQRVRAYRGPHEWGCDHLECSCDQAREELAECDAYTAILDGYAKLVEQDAATRFGDPDQRSAFYQYENVVLPALALAYRHHEGYREEWRP